MKQLIELIKQHWGLVILLLIIIGLILAGFLREQQKNSTNNVTLSSTQASSSDGEAEPETNDEKNYRKAKLALEHPYSEVSEGQKQAVTPDILSGMAFISNHQKIDEMTPTLDNHLYMSETAMIQSVWIAIHVNGYQFQSSQLEVLKSDSDDVVQFLLTLTKSGADNVYVIGNFNTTVTQLQITEYFGGPIGATYG